jgi:processive 1,2-diacylglycerol beta-glucosyltransferase
VIRLLDKDSGTEIGTVTDEQLQFLVDNLEEEFAEDTDYYINSPTIDLLQENGADSGLVELLRRALGDREGVEIKWTQG